MPCLAQDVTGPPVATPETTLYTHSAGSGATKWMSTLKKDAAGTDATVTLAFPGGSNTGSTASFKLVPAPNGTVVLDVTKDIQFNIRFGSGLAANYGTVSTKLRSGSTEIASATGTATQTVSSYGDVKLTAKAKVATLPTGQDLVWDITFAGEGSAYIQVGQSDMYCNLVLPVLSAPLAGNATANQTAKGNATANANATKAPTNTTAPPSAGSQTASALAAGNATAGATPTKQTPFPAAAVIPSLGLVAWVAQRRRRAL